MTPKPSCPHGRRNRRASKGPECFQYRQSVAGKKNSGQIQESEKRVFTTPISESHTHFPKTTPPNDWWACIAKVKFGQSDVTAQLS